MRHIEIELQEAGAIDPLLDEHPGQQGLDNFNREARSVDGIEMRQGQRPVRRDDIGALEGFARRQCQAQHVARGQWRHRHRGARRKGHALRWGHGKVGIGATGQIAIAPLTTERHLAHTGHGPAGRGIAVSCQVGRVARLLERCGAGGQHKGCQGDQSGAHRSEPARVAASQGLGDTGRELARHDRT